MDKPWKAACGQALEGGLWTSLGRWPVEKPWKVACGQALVCSWWTSLGMLSVGKLQ